MPAPHTPARRFFLIVMLLLFSIDLMKHAIVFGSGLQQPWPDAIGYWRLGSAIASGDLAMLSQPIGFRTPGYPWLVAIARTVGGWFVSDSGLLILALLQHAMALATHLLVLLWVWQITSSRTLVLGAYALALWNLSRATHANWVLTETAATLLMLGAANLAWRYWGCEKSLPAICLAVIVALAILVRPVSIIFIPLLGAFLWSLRPPRRRPLSLGAILILLVFLGPCVLRNYFLFGRPQLVTFQGRELWTTTFSPWPGARLPIPTEGAGQRLQQLLASSEVLDPLEVRPLNLRHNWEVSTRLSAAGLDDGAIDQLMQQVAVQAISKAPWKSVFCTAARMGTFWYCWAWPAEEEPASHTKVFAPEIGHSGNATCRWLAGKIFLIVPESSRWTTIVLTIYVGVGLVRMLLCGERGFRRAALIIGFLLLATTVLTAVLEIPTYRYRLPLEPLIIVVLASGIAKIRPDFRFGGMREDMPRSAA